MISCNDVSGRQRFAQVAFPGTALLREVFYHRENETKTENGARNVLRTSLSTAWPFETCELMIYVSQSIGKKCILLSEINLKTAFDGATLVPLTFFFVWRDCSL